MSQLKFVAYNLFRLFIFCIIGFIPRDKRICVFNCMTNSFNKTYGFTHNAKYLYLYISQHKELNIKAIWITPNKNIVKELCAHGYKAYYKNSIQGIYYCLRAKYYILNVDILNAEISKWLSGGAIKINLWHGIPLKHIGNDNNKNYVFRPKWQKLIHQTLIQKNDYMIANSKYDGDIDKTAFFMQDSQIKILGSPRIDTIFNCIKDENLFMEKDINNIINMKKNGKKLFLYMPTYRDTGKSTTTWINSNTLYDFLEKNNIVLLCKLHPVDSNNLNFQSNDLIYVIDNNSDINAILKYTDALITDYSSVAFDYLLLDKPIIYHAPDLDEYQQTCHGFYINFSDFTMGDVTSDTNQLINSMQKIIQGDDGYQSSRRDLREKLFIYGDDNNSKRVAQFIKQLK